MEVVVVMTIISRADQKAFSGVEVQAPTKILQYLQEIGYLLFLMYMYV